MSKFLNNILSFFQKTAPPEEKTAPLSDEFIKDNLLLVENEFQPIQLIVGSGQSIGRQRDHNEDSLFTLTAVLADQGNKQPFGIYIVADGMGGHQHGEIASQVAIRTLSNHLLKQIYFPFFQYPPSAPNESLQEIMAAGILEANRAVQDSVPGGGTTLTAVLIFGDQMTIGHVGDSRVYQVNSNHQMEALTRDHSLVQRLIELGQITIEEAAVHPQRSVLYRALGQGEPFTPDVSTAQFPKSACLLVCSDGLWGVVPEDEMAEIIHQASTFPIACQKLINAANAAGGPDNISAILIRKAT